jgi:hypothetical protein
MALADHGVGIVSRGARVAERVDEEWDWNRIKTELLRLRKVFLKVPASRGRPS